MKSQPRWKPWGDHQVRAERFFNRREKGMPKSRRHTRGSNNFYTTALFRFHDNWYKM